MYATIFKGDPLDPGRGKLYRDKILRVGGSREELDSLRVGFLLPNIIATVIHYFLTGLPWERAEQ